MGSSYFGEPNMGNDRAVGPRKSKKSGSEKPKQPQRGLGVAQLEKIRLHGQMGSGGGTAGGCSPYGQFHHQYPSAPYPITAFSQEDLRGQTAYSLIPSSSISYTSSASASSASYGFNTSFKMGTGGNYERGSRRYGDQSSTHASWGTSNSLLEMPQYMQPSMTKHLLHVEDPHPENHKKHRSSSLGASSHTSEVNDGQELDLELRLSL